MNTFSLNKAKLFDVEQLSEFLVQSSERVLNALWANKHDHSLPVATRNWTLLGFSVQCGSLSAFISLLVFLCRRRMGQRRAARIFVARPGKQQVIHTFLRGGASNTDSMCCIPNTFYTFAFVVKSLLSIKSENSFLVQSLSIWRATSVMQMEITVSFNFIRISSHSRSSMGSL